ncbi:sialate O-acetylesterase [Luteolibacter marinus]|uniref:sialate O-acetylesterase n=1 Tax=Luteolibacter marinus TaxID=2776705 RepID=UPI001868F0DB|nr:sialate O-acetylesterase [Luteolibacter marinus]
MSGLRRFLRRWLRPPLRGAWSIPGDRREFRVFLLMGQSNMAGFGSIRSNDPWQPGDFTPVPRVLVLGGQCGVKSSRPRGWTHWRPAAHPLHLNQASAGFGLGLPFATRLLQDPGTATIGLIPCAWGGAGIDSLGPGSPLYQNATRRARLAANTGTLAGVLWHQGETDAATGTLALAHAGKLTHFIQQLRRDLAHPDLPFLIGDLANFGDDRRDAAAVELRALVRNGLRQVAAGDPRAAFVESEGLAGVDGVHFNRESLVRFGERYAEAYFGLH